MLWLTRLVARSLNNASHHFGRKEPEHLTTARRGEMEAYFHLRDQGYCVVAKNFRTPHNRGEIDLIGWDRGVLCFVEVKTQAQRGLVLRRWQSIPPRNCTSCRSPSVMYGD
jgi:Holliday junction resolvase-like predicted endonuclease